MFLSFSRYEVTDVLHDLAGYFFFLVRILSLSLNMLEHFIVASIQLKMWAENRFSQCMYLIHEGLTDLNCSFLASTRNRLILAR